MTPPDTQDLLAWSESTRRDLPWRRTRDPWEVLVAEVMLQQTQVDRVVPRWERFLGRWPTTRACAAAPLSDVLVEWHGLGYPRRARSLHAAARHIESEHGGEFPRALPELLALPGVGPYTARAVQAFAFELDAAVVDTNVGRILARHSGARLSPRAAQALADDWLPTGRAWAWNQGLLDLGAGWCRPRRPACGDCPLAPGCAWQVAGRPEPDPAAGSAGVSRRQARFEGSARQARGRLLGALGTGPVELAGVARIVGWEDRDDAAGDCERLVDGLVRDGLVRREPGGAVALAS